MAAKHTHQHAISAEKANMLVGTQQGIGILDMVGMIMGEKDSPYIVDIQAVMEQAILHDIGSYAGIDENA